MALRVAGYPDLIRHALTRIRQLRGRSLLRRFTLSATKRTARFTLCLLITRRNWKRRCSNASTMVEKTGDLLRLRPRRQRHLLHRLDVPGFRPSRKALTFAFRARRCRMEQTQSHGWQRDELYFQQDSKGPVLFLKDRRFQPLTPVSSYNWQGRKWPVW